MNGATLTIGRKERDALHWLMVRRIFTLGQDPPRLARAERVSLDELTEEFGEDLRLMADLGWEVEDDRRTVALTMPAAGLAKTIRRLRRDARRAPFEAPREHEPQGTDEGRWERFREAVDACDEVLDLLDAPHRGDTEESAGTDCSVAPTARELAPGRPSEIMILAAVRRAACHERTDEVGTATVADHLGFEPTTRTIRQLGFRLDRLRSGGSLTRIERDGGARWVLTYEGREEVEKRSEVGEVAELPEAPQHRAWREARVQAGLCIEAFKEQMGKILEEAGQLLATPHPPSAEWFALSERLSPAAWRLGSATHCLYEWLEPDDEHPDVDEAPGPSPGRRAISAWDQPISKSGGPS